MNGEIIYNLSRLKSIEGTASFSKDNKYRYILTRNWVSKDSEVDGSIINWIMCNPSTADAKVLDPTVAKCLYWSILWGYQVMIVTNVFALRSTWPTELYRADDPIGPENDNKIQMVMGATARNHGRIICGYGNHGLYLDRHLTIQSYAASMKIDLYYLELNKGDVPKHPLYIRKSITPTLWRQNAAPTNDIQQG